MKRLCVALVAAACVLLPVGVAGADDQTNSAGILTTRLDPPTAPLEESLAAAVEKLNAIVAARDVKGLVAMLSPTVTSSFGDDGGPERFVANYGLEGPDAAQAEIWGAMERLLAIGVAQGSDPSWAAAPWPYAIWPEDLDPFIHMVVIAQGESLRAAPKSDAPALHPLDYDILTVVFDEENPDPYVIETLDGQEIIWIKVADPAGQIGYVRDEWVLSTLDYRLGFERSEAGWLISFMVAGD